MTMFSHSIRCSARSVRSKVLPALDQKVRCSSGTPRDGRYAKQTRMSFDESAQDPNIGGTIWTIRNAGLGEIGDGRATLNQWSHDCWVCQGTRRCL
jgi:hypothetical protein